MPDGLSVLIVDDEPLARRQLRELVAELDDITDVREAPNGSEAIRLIHQRRPDVVFLDVQMPRIDGFGVIEAIGTRVMPPVIFVTAADRFAVRALEAHAVDYLAKPVDPDRFRDAVERVRRVIASDAVEALRSTLATLIQSVRESRTVTDTTPTDGAARRMGTPRIPVRLDGRIVSVDPGEIDWVESLGNYVELHGRERTLRHRSTMDAMETLLGPSFVRIRRSLLVRATAILFCESLGKGCWVVVLRDQTRLTSSRYYRAQLGAVLGE
jgi:two-component system, LytTR family, response regulator